MAEITVGAVVLSIVNALSQEGVRTEGAIFRGIGSRITNFQRELEEIQRNFESIKSLLRATNMEEEEDPDIVGKWVADIRSVAHEVEDIVDEYHYFLNKAQAGHLKALRHKVDSAKRYKFISDLAQRMEKVKPSLDKCCRNRDLLAIVKLKKRVEDSGSLYPHVDQSPVGTVENEMLLLKWLLGEQEEGNDVFAAEPRSRQEAVIAVVGMGGLGKTTLVSKVYNNTVVHRRFNRRAWVSVSNICRVESFLAAILEQLLNSKYEHDSMEGKESLFEQMRAVLQENRCVIVLDDARETCGFDLRKEIQDLLDIFHSNTSTIRILITTRYRSIATLLANEDRILQLQFLNQEQGLSLFCKTAFADGVCPKNLEAYASEMAHKCGGLPLALVSVGSMMSTKRKDSVIWERILSNPIYETNGQLSGSLYNIMVPSFYDLPHHQRQCFFYLAIYPNGRLISRKSLIRLWAAEGFVESRDGMTSEEVAEEYLLDLVSRSMIQVEEWNEFGRVRNCKLHVVVREMALRIIKRQQHFTIEGSPQELDYSSVRRLSVHRLYKKALPPNADFNRLRSMIVFDKDYVSVSECLDRFTGTMKLLKVLDLRGIPVESIPKSIFDLFNLQYLSLRDTKVRELPRDIKRLRSLQTLDLWNTEVEILPYKVYKLQKLRHLICGPKAVKFKYKFKIKKYKHGIWNLVNLQTLKIIESDYQVASRIGNLLQLRTLFISNVSHVQENSFCGSISRLINLMGLTIKIDDGADMRLLNINPPRHLTKLEIRGKLRAAPNWLDQLLDLKKLILSDSELEKNPLDRICNLGSLAFLCLSKVCTDSELHFLPQQFSHLKILHIKYMPVTNIVIHEGSLPSLQKLYICCCKDLETIPHIRHLRSSLKEVRLKKPTPPLKAGLEKICHSMSSVVLMQN